MILFFRTPSKSVIAVESNHQLTPDESNKLCWLFGEAVTESEENLKGCFVGPRREMITPWSTNAVEITQNMGLEGITRIEEYFPVKDENADHDPMLQRTGGTTIRGIRAMEDAGVRAAMIDAIDAASHNA